MYENLKQAKAKKAWSPPALTIYGNVEELTQGDPRGTRKDLGTGDDILAQQNNGISSIP